MIKFTLCFFYFELDEGPGSSKPNPVENLDVSAESIRILEDNIMNCIREIGKETWNQVMSEFEE